jgi:hypothetical protein
MIKYHISYAVVFYDFSRVFYELNMICVASLRVARRATDHTLHTVHAVVLCKSSVAPYWGTTASVTRRVIPILYDSKSRVTTPTAIVHRNELMVHPYSLLWYNRILWLTTLRHCIGPP